MSKNIFNSVKVDVPKSNYFDLTHDVKMSGKGGWLMPALTMEVFPGDRVNLASDIMVRMAPMIAPVMSRVDVFAHNYFVPSRVLWPGFDRFIRGDAETNVDPEPVMPYLILDGNNAAPGTPFANLADFMGVPPNRDPLNLATLKINALPFAAYNKIYNDYYRDENLIGELPGALLTDGQNSVANYQIRQRAYEHDYFTSALPWAQKGQPVGIPINDMEVRLNNVGSTTLTGIPISPVVGGNNHTPDVPADTLYADSATNTTNINDLRRAYALQRWLERNARSGNRLAELIKGTFGVNYSDARLQRAEYIGGVKAPIIISEVLNTTGFEIPQGNMAGHGVSVGSGKTGSYFCEEWGYVMTIVSIMPKQAYKDGIDRMYTKFDRFDYPWPDFAHIGEQPIMNQELYAWCNDQEGTFGYIPRYAEYKYMKNRVAGEFTDALKYWTLQRDFLNPTFTPPALNPSFIQCNPADFDDIFALGSGTETDQFYMHILHKIGANRKLPIYGNPI